MGIGLDEFLGVGVLGRMEEGVAFFELDEGAMVHDGDAVGEVADHGEVVADEEKGEVVLLLELFEERSDLPLDGEIERGEGFIADEKLGLANESSGDGHPLSLPPAELMGIADKESR